MGFFYISVFSLIFIAFVYGAALLMFWLIWTKALGRKFSGPAVWAIAALILIAPWVEEIWIAWTFGQLCKKDAGLFISKTVDVDGYYDATARLIGIRDSVMPAASEDFDRRGFKYYELSLSNPSGRTTKVAHFEKASGVWRVTVLDYPKARFHYRMSQFHSPVVHRIKAFEWLVEDVESKSVIAREKAYAREPYWFYIGLDRPTMFCPIFGDFGEKLTVDLYRLALKPTRN